MSTEQPDYITAGELRDYIKREIASGLANRQEPKKRGLFHWVGSVINVILTLVIFTLVIAVLGYIAAQQYGVPLPLSLSAPPSATFSTPQGGPARQAPQSMPAVRENGAQPRLQPFYNKTPAPVFVGEIQKETAEPTATSGNFYTSEEQTAYAISDAETATAVVATATAFYDVETLPTPEPTFTSYVAEQCQDKEKVKLSWLLQQMCVEE